MASKRNVKIETPGAPENLQDPATAENPVSAAAALATSELSPPAFAKVADDGAAMTAKQEKDLKGQLLDTAKLVGAHDALDWSHLAGAGLKPSVAKVDPDAHLPAADSVDPEKITAPVLTKSGWVLPQKDPRARLIGR